MPAPAAPFPRGLAAWAWRAFLVWTGVGFIVLPTGLDETLLRAWISAPRLCALAIGFLHISDAIWMLLAAMNAYFCTVAASGRAHARLQAALVLAVSTAVEWIGTRTGFPFGPYVYTDRFGPRLGGVVPVAIPLAWLVIILCGRGLMDRWRPAATRWQTALGIAAVALITDLNLEFVAWKIRGYWIWYPGRVPPPSSWPPVSNFFAWVVLSFALGCVLPMGGAPGPARRAAGTRAVVILLLLNALLAATHLAAVAGIVRFR